MFIQKEDTLPILYISLLMLFGISPNLPKVPPCHCLKSRTASLSLSPAACWAWRAERATGVRPVCRGPWSEERPASGRGQGPECVLCCGRRRCCWGSPAWRQAWTWLPALCASAPASAAPESLRGHEHWSWTSPGIRYVTPGRRGGEGSPWMAAVPLLACTPCPTSPGTPCWGSYGVA